MLPDFLAFHTARPPRGDSLNWELEALAFATKILQNDRTVPTTFYSDCLSAVELVTSDIELKRKHLSHGRAGMIQILRKIFHKGGCWKLEWVCRERNRVADHISRCISPEFAQKLKTRDKFRVYTLSVKEQKFYELNGGIVTPDVRRKLATVGNLNKEIRENKPRTIPPANKIAGVDSSTVTRINSWRQENNLLPLLWDCRQTIDQLFTCA